MRKIIYSIFLIGSLIVLWFIFPSPKALAYQIENINVPPLEPGEQGDFVIGPGKTELWLDPGDKLSKYIFVTNRLGKTMNFKVEIEDFLGSYDPETTVRLLGGEKSPFSLKDYLEPELTEFTLENGQRIRLPVKISIPENMEPGGLYGAIIVSATNPPVTVGRKEKEAETQIRIVTRLASLFFIRVKGDVLEDGFLKDFITQEKFYETGPIPFEILYENTGNVHLSPYGIIEIKNTLGQKVGEIPLDAWFAMPQSLRSRKTNWERKWLFGRYTAIAKINRGYKDIIDEKSVSFWVIPWKIVLVVFGILFVIIWFFVWLASHFEIRRKPRQVS